MSTPSNSDPDPARAIDSTNPSEEPPASSAPDVHSALPGATLEHERFRSEKQLVNVLSGKTLKRGAVGSGVKALQQAFIDMGFLLPNTADGVFGRQTAKAVRNFQVHASKYFANVTATSTVNAVTLLALDKLAPAVGATGQADHVPIAAYKGVHVRVVVIKDEHRTFMYDKQGQLQRIFMNAVGASATPTSTGLKFISAKLDEATATEVGLKLWGAPVFGARILDLTWANGKSSGEELHGTLAPEHLGEDVSHGCIRHANPDIIAMYDILHVGEKVAIVENATDPNLHV